VYAFEEHEAVVEGVSSRRELTEEVGPAHPPLVVLDLNSNGQADVATGLSEQNVAYVFFDVTGFEKERYDVSVQTWSFEGSATEGPARRLASRWGGATSTATGTTTSSLATGSVPQEAAASS
jgi:hypothetical protein